MSASEQLAINRQNQAHTPQHEITHKEEAQTAVKDTPYNMVGIFMPNIRTHVYLN